MQPNLHEDDDETYLLIAGAIQMLVITVFLGVIAILLYPFL